MAKMCRTYICTVVIESIEAEYCVWHTYCTSSLSVPETSCVWENTHLWLAHNHKYYTNAFSMFVAMQLFSNLFTIVSPLCLFLCLKHYWQLQQKLANSLTTSASFRVV